MNTAFIHKFVSAFFSSLLQQNGFKTIEEIYTPEVFGNFLIKMASSDFQIRFLRDRNQVFVDIASPNSNRWYKLEYVLEFVDPDIYSDDFGSPPEIDKLARSLEKNYRKVQALFADDAVQLRLERFEKTKTESFINKIFDSQ